MRTKIKATKEPNWGDITKRQDVIALIKMRNYIEQMIMELDGNALINYELWKLRNK